MGYYIRVLGENINSISSSRIQEWLLEEGLKNLSVIVEEGNDDNWQQVLIKRKRGKELFTIEKSLTIPKSTGAEEIKEFLNEIEHAKPNSAVKWLKKYLPKVKIIYAFQILFGKGQNDDWNTLHILQSKIWNEVHGILQADGEGFSNKEGYHILWQFSDDVKGPWNMAVINLFGIWHSFQMDLGNFDQRISFLEGKVPRNSRPTGGIGK